MKERGAKAERVIDCAMALLRNEGDRGVTMRRVAQDAGMSLSNVQYYFKNKDALLKAMADRYFYQCLEDIEGEPFLFETNDQTAALRAVSRNFLAHGLEVSDMCRVFREYWALATRNAEIENYLVNYYSRLSAVLKDKLRPLAIDESALDEAVSLFIPVVEGYSITCPALPVDIDRMTELTADLLLSALHRERDL